MKQQTIDVAFNGNMQISAAIDDFIIATDQSVKEGGDGTAPNPFQLFLASMATCAGVYAKRFCETRKLETKGLGLRIICDYAEKGFKVEKITYEISLPEGFPEKYKAPLIRAVDLCTVKKHVTEAPDFEIVTK